VPPNVLLDDLEQAALIGLFEWKKAHPDEDAPGWIGGLTQRIRGSIKDELRHQDWLPRRARKAARGAESPMIVVGCDDADKDWEAHWAGAGESIEDVVVRKREVAHALLAPLKPRDERIVRLAYFRDVNLKDIGRSFGCSEPRISQLHARAIEVMRAHLTGEGRRPTTAQRAKRKQKEKQHAGADEFESPPSGIYPKCGGAVTSTLPEEGVDLRAELARYQQWMVDQALIRANGNEDEAAKLLGLEPSSFTAMLQPASTTRAASPPEAVAPSSGDSRIATLRTLGYSAKRVAGKLGVNYWVIEREYRRLAALEASQARREVGA